MTMRQRGQSIAYSTYHQFRMHSKHGEFESLVRHSAMRLLALVDFCQLSDCHQVGANIKLLFHYQSDDTAGFSQSVPVKAGAASMCLSSAELAAHSVKCQIQCSRMPGSPFRSFFRSAGLICPVRLSLVSMFDKVGLRVDLCILHMHTLWLEVLATLCQVQRPCLRCT